MVYADRVSVRVQKIFIELDYYRNRNGINARTASEVCLSIAMRVKQRRLELNLTQQGLALRADVNIETYRKFERTGVIAVLNLAKIAFALQALDDFDLLFSQKKYQNIDEVILEKPKNRKRGKKF